MKKQRRLDLVTLATQSMLEGRMRGETRSGSDGSIAAAITRPPADLEIGSRGGRMGDAVPGVNLRLKAEDLVRDTRETVAASSASWSEVFNRVDAIFSLMAQFPSNLTALARKSVERRFITPVTHFSKARADKQWFFACVAERAPAGLSVFLENPNAARLVGGKDVEEADILWLAWNDTWADGSKTLALLDETIRELEGHLAVVESSKKQ